MEYINLPDLKGLAALKAVIELGGVNQAAQALYIGQPAITKRLRALEQCYNTRLFTKEGRKLELTQAGQRVFEFAQLTINQQSALVEDLRFLNKGEHIVRLEVTSSIGEHFLPDVLLAFNEQYPQYQINSRMGYSRHIKRHLATGLADIALVELAPNHPEIIKEKWLSDEIILVCSPQHAISNHSNVDLKSLTQYEFVQRESQSSIRLILDKELKQQGMESLPTSLEVGSTDTIIEIISRGKHLGFLPRFAARDALQTGELISVPVNNLSIHITLWIAQNTIRKNHKASNAFIQQLRKARDDSK